LIPELYRALDAQRAAQGLSWRDVSAATGVSVATIMRTRKGGRMEVDGMIALVGWLEVPVESFVRSSGDMTVPSTKTNS
jgi:transcriptional regulator with XRE-family HTH domain